MILLDDRNESLSSLPTISAQSWSSESNTDATSFGTFTGPGTLAGKAIYRLGKATLKGVEQVIIYRRLSTISNYFPHGNTTEVRGMRQMYTDLLELSRPTIYSKAIRDQALRMLLSQIGARQTRYLLHSVSLWPQVELRLLVSDILARFDPLLTPPLSKDRYLQDPIVKAYRTHVPERDDHSLLPLVDFLDQISSISDDCCIAVLQSGALDFILNLYLTGFHDPAQFTHKMSSRSPRSALRGACNSLFFTVLQNTSGVELLRGHRVTCVWSTHPALSFALSLRENAEAWSIRQQFWRKADKTVLKWRITSIHMLTMDRKRELDLNTATDALVDCFKLIRPEFPVDIIYRALRSLHEAVARARRLSVFARYTNVGTAMRNYLSASSQKDAVVTLSRIIEVVMALSAGNTIASNSFCLADDEPTFLVDAVAHFVYWLTSISESDEEYRRMILTTDIVRLAERALEKLEKSLVDDRVSFRDLANDYWKEKDIELYRNVYGLDALDAPLHIHVLRWSLVLLRDQSQGRRFRILSLPESWWVPGHKTDADLVYRWLKDE
ncbi:hypothetical protein Moror_12795 [Moniliophthora roreri MCA 2997]|uniref:Uncharacterized protein n=1 Tax=Moniliophthora roreri (strain MCA 2997) TaxID=1381753 RepID=V2XNG2_MONRO|nr:hypothetical protein Moror_12795 [Moniliophthora roreri MCA 2997]